MDNIDNNNIENWYIAYRTTLIYNMVYWYNIDTTLILYIIVILVDGYTIGYTIL